MAQIFTLGETVLDVLFKDGSPVSCIAGGSMLNTAVALGRTSGNVHFISEFGLDEPGNIIDRSLEINHVSTVFTVKYSDYNTSIALAFLDENLNASYTFYHHQPEVLPDIDLPEFSTGDVLAFGSFYSVKPSRRQHVLRIAEKARSCGTFIVFDPNVRKHHLADMPSVREKFYENMQMSNLVKGSHEDFEFLAGTNDPDEIYELLRPYCPFLVITQGEKEVLLYTPEFLNSYMTPVIKPVSTIGAGDNFTAGLIYGLVNGGLTKQHPSAFTRADWNKLIACGIAFSSATCLTMENYVSPGFKPEI